MATLSPEAAMRITLIADDTYSAITTRAYPMGMVPQNATLPYSTYMRISTVRNPHLGAASGIIEARIQWDHYAASFGTVRDMAEAMREAFDGMVDATITSGDDSLPVMAFHLENENDTALPPDGGAELRVLGVSQDWIVHYGESVPTFS